MTTATQTTRAPLAEYIDTVRSGVLDDDTFVELTLSGQPRGGALPYKRIVVRPVLVKQRRRLQFSYFTQTQDITKNYADEEAERALNEALALPFPSVRLRSTTQEIRVQRTKKGEAVIHRSAPPVEAPRPSLAHDREKDVPLPAGRPDAFLQAIGIADAAGKVRPGMHAKYAQVNEFLKLLDHTADGRGVQLNAPAVEGHPLRIADLGCGAAHLTFAAYHYLNDVRGIPAEVVGVDRNARLIERCERQREQLGYEGLRFEPSAIAEYAPDAPPDIVLALHACDTATDDALAAAIRAGARLVLAAPCCHHDLNGKLRSDVLAPVLRFGILEQRQADLVTDAFRALALRIMGYRTDVVEFISPEHTSRNLMVRAVKGAPPGDPSFAREYRELKAFFDVTPFIEGVLGEELARYVDA